MQQAQSKVLLVDDDTIDLKVLTRRLHQEGYAVESATDGVEALRKLRTGQFDLVLLDILMPRLSGFEVLREIRRVHSLDTLPVIMVTAAENNDDMVKALSLGANDYLTKAMAPRVALARIANQLNLKRLAAANKEFLHIASHDMKKPLAVLKDILETLRRDYPSGTLVTAHLHELLALSLKTLEHMEHLVQNCLDLGVIESGRIQMEREAVDLNRVVRQTVENNTFYAQQKEHALKLDLYPTLPLVQGDEFRLTQVIDNLVGNAIKFSPRGSTTTVRTRLEYSHVLCEVQDSGPGLTEEDLQKVFVTRFTPLSNAPTGGEASTGLGLTICKQLIDLQGGDIGVYNNPAGPGATFWLRLPLRQVA